MIIELVHIISQRLNSTKIVLTISRKHAMVIASVIEEDFILLHWPLLWKFIYLVLGGVVSGVLSSAASFASLASYPLLLSVGIPPVFANVTNDAALIWNMPGAVLSSIRELHGHWRLVRFYSLFTMAGAAIGCYLLLKFPSGVFEKVVPFFILLAGIMVYQTSKRKVVDKPQAVTGGRKLLYVVLLLVNGVYGGYFGAASGIITLVILTYLTNKDFVVVNAIKNVVGGVANLTALIIYMFASKIYWNAAIPMAVGMFIGGYLGPKIVRHVPQKGMEQFIAFLAVVQAAYFFWQAYFK